VDFLERPTDSPLGCVCAQRLWDFCQAQDEARRFVDGGVDRECPRDGGVEEDEIGPLPIPLGLLAPDGVAERLAEIVLRPQLVVVTGCLSSLHRLVAPSVPEPPAMIPGRAAASPKKKAA